MHSIPVFCSYLFKCCPLSLHSAPFLSFHTDSKKCIRHTLSHLYLLPFYQSLFPLFLTSTQCLLRYFLFFSSCLCPLSFTCSSICSASLLLFTPLPTQTVSFYGFITLILVYLSTFCLFHRPRAECSRACVRPAFSMRCHPSHQDSPAISYGHLSCQRKQRCANGQ